MHKKMKEDFKILCGGQKSQNEGSFKKFVQKSILLILF